MNQYFLPLLFGAILVPASAPGQVVEQFAPPRANCCLPATAKSLADQLQGWNQLGRYYADNQSLQQLPPDPGRSQPRGLPFTFRPLPRVLPISCRTGINSAATTPTPRASSNCRPIRAASFSSAIPLPMDGGSLSISRASPT